MVRICLLRDVCTIKATAPILMVVSSAEACLSMHAAACINHSSILQLRFSISYQLQQFSGFGAFVKVRYADMIVLLLLP